VLPPTTFAGFTLTVMPFDALIVRVAVVVAPLSVAVIVAVELTFVAVETVNVPVVAPAAIVTVAGGVAWLVDEDRATTRPPVGAGLEIVTVPVELVPEVTVLGFSVRLTNVGAVTAKTAVAV
jgi:hypothetical protein